MSTGSKRNSSSLLHLAGSGKTNQGNRRWGEIKKNLLMLTVFGELSNIHCSDVQKQHSIHF